MLHPLERAEAAALLDAVRALGPAFAAEHGFAATVVGRAVCLLARALPAMRELNHVIGADGATDLDALAAFYGGAPHIVSGDDEAAQALQARGYTPGYAWMKFARAADPDAHAPTDLRVEVVGAERA